MVMHKHRPWILKSVSRQLLTCCFLFLDTLSTFNLLFPVSGAARQRIDSVMPGLLGAEEAVRSAKEDLQTRVGASKRSASTASIMSLPASLDAGIRRGSSILKMFSSKRTVVMGVPETSVPATTPQVRDNLYTCNVL